MTVATQVKTCLASLKSAQASLEQFALSAQTLGARRACEKAAQTTQQIVDRLSARIMQLEPEERQPQSS